MAQEAYATLGKIYPSICIGMACVESGFGYGSNGSRLMYKHNAVFGQKVGTGRTATRYWSGKFFTAKTSEEYTVGVHTVILQSAFRAYDTLKQGVFNYYELLNTSLYKKVQANVDYVTQMQQIKQCGYMTSTSEVNSVLWCIRTYDLTKYDNVVSVKVEKPVETVETVIATKYKVGKTYVLLSDLYVRDQPDGIKIKYEALTLNAKKNGTFDEYGQAILKAGTKVTCKDIKVLNTSTWLRIPSGWICARNSKTEYVR